MKTKRVQAFGILFIGSISALLMAGCANPNKGPGTEEKQAAVANKRPDLNSKTVSVNVKKTNVRKMETQNDYYHTVRWHGETLAYIAKWYTGNLHNWKVLAKANPALNPNRIYKGNQIVIPEGVLKTRKPLPKNFLAVLTPKKTVKKPSSKPSQQPKEEEALPLFGPKEH